MLHKVCFFAVLGFETQDFARDKEALYQLSLLSSLQKFPFFIFMNN